MRERRVLGSLLALMLVGCSDSDLPTLERQLAELRARPTGQVAPLPEAPEYRPVTYDQAAGRSPFVPERPEPEQATVDDSSLTPDFERRKEPLEAYALESLTLLGTLRIDDRASVLVRDPEGEVHRLHPGEHLGTDFGRITRIDERSVQLMEIVPNGQGGWIERSRTIALNDEDEEKRQG
ncbi:type IV pilus assembly protein PilP [Modicisalibacter ilicicola DSM 19980]|uniref:Type IV pilus assembly protein PilP n=1 Tax=Modicisalibacter ilicicola DSM 19980 TaxID=1121942 RepID=A0A1M4V1C7_9GAMM|nr:pilus assembly protein PilP [Halomonas ilicicola]SHE62765.1 type IV pilus assembly protein PilP [Halomonas ilicicola DSM 19980]